MELKIPKNEPAQKGILEPLFRHLDEVGLGHISEIADGHWRACEDGNEHMTPRQSVVNEEKRRLEEDRYFDVFVEYAKAGPEDLLMRVTVHNRGFEDAVIHLLPHVWFRNTWSWNGELRKPRLAAAGKSTIKAHHPRLGTFNLYAEGDPALLFCENETNVGRLYGVIGAKAYYLRSDPKTPCLRSALAFGQLRTSVSNPSAGFRRSFRNFAAESASEMPKLRASALISSMSPIISSIVNSPRTAGLSLFPVDRRGLVTPGARRPGPPPRSTAHWQNGQRTDWARADHNRSNGFWGSLV